MKLSKALNKAIVLHLQYTNILEPFSEKLRDTLDDESVFFHVQPGEGMVIAYNGGFGNAAVELMDVDIDHLFKLDRDELLEALEGAAI